MQYVGCDSFLKVLLTLGDNKSSAELICILGNLMNTSSTVVYYYYVVLLLLRRHTNLKGTQAYLIIYIMYVMRLTSTGYIKGGTLNVGYNNYCKISQGLINVKLCPTPHLAPATSIR